MTPITAAKDLHPTRYYNRLHNSMGITSYEMFGQFENSVYYLSSFGIACQ